MYAHHYTLPFLSGLMLDWKIAFTVMVIGWLLHKIRLLCYYYTNIDNIEN